MACFPGGGRRHVQNHRVIEGGGNMSDQWKKQILMVAVDRCGAGFRGAGDGAGR